MLIPSRRPARTLLLVAVLCSAALLAAACGDGGSEGSGTAGSDAGGTSSEGGTGTEDAAFPVTIEHRYGDTTVDARPERVVTVGLSDQDPLVALGVVPVGTTEWFGDHPGALWPWAADEVDGAVPEVVSTADAINFEAIAAQRPDLILGVYSGMTQGDYDKLSQIAPTIAQPGDYVDYGVPWQEQTLIVGRAIGESERAEQLVAEVEEQFEQVRAEHPEFDGASGVIASPYSEDKIAIYGPEDVRGRFMSSLGFVQSPEIAEIAGEEFSADIGQERIDLLDTDVLVVLLPDLDENLPLLERQTLFTNLAVHKEGRGVYVDTYGPVGGATSFVTVLSLPFLLDELVPKLAAAIDGDPSTTA